MIRKYYRSGKNRIQSQSHQIKLRFKYGQTLADANRIIWIDPETVTHKLISYFHGSVPNNSQTYVMGGQWDRRYTDPNLLYTRDFKGLPEQRTLLKIKNLDWYRSFTAHFNYGVPWEDTELYQRRIGEGFNTARYNSEEGLRTRLSNIEDLYYSIKNEGYKTQADLAGDTSSPLTATDWRHEIKINLSRTGEPILDDGRNRLILAKLLGVDEIPVRVLVRHKHWQEVRKRLANATSIEELPNELRAYAAHPDVQDVADFSNQYQD